MTRARFLFLLAGATALSIFGLPSAHSSLGHGGAAHAQSAEAEQDTGSTEIVEMTLGDPDAPITVVEYASFTCPHCATFHKTVFKELKENFIDTGKVQFVHREVYFDRFGLWAGMVARCGGPERYFGITDMVYSTQSEWTSGGDPATVVGNLRRIGKTAGLSDAELDACLADGEKAEALVAWYQENADADGVQGTPTFIIDGVQHSNMSYDDFAEILDEKLSN
ncbi:MAG: DsbA family protein [Rhodobacteraceae bacterium]|nr:DsbA family protein [Paracoccaceae bacterium]